MLDEILAEIEQDLIFYEQSGGGVTFSGGEPLLQPALLKALLHACAEKDIHTALDTCGYATWESIDQIRETVGIFLYDLKLMGDAQHRKYTGVPNRLILNNLQRLSEQRERIVVRVPVIPGINDQTDHLHQIGNFLAGLPFLERVDLLAYHKIGIGKYTSLQKEYQLTDVQPPSGERMAELAGICEGYGLNVKIGA